MHWSDTRKPTRLGVTGSAIVQVDASGAHIATYNFHQIEAICLVRFALGERLKKPRTCLTCSFFPDRWTTFLVALPSFTADTAAWCAIFCAV